MGMQKQRRMVAAAIALLLVVGLGVSTPVSAAYSDEDDFYNSRRSDGGWVSGQGENFEAADVGIGEFRGEQAPSTTTPKASGNVPASGSTGASSSGGGLSNAIPSIDFAMRSGESFPLRVNAPSGGSVVVEFNGKSYTLKEKSSYSGIGLYTGDYKFPEVSGTQELGKATYYLTSKGKTTKLESKGSLFAVGNSSTLKVQVKNTSATAFASPTSRASGYITTVKKGAIDPVIDYYGNMYRLSSVGWVDASACTPLTQNYSTLNQVSQVSFQNTTDGELFTLHGTTHPPYRAVQNGNQLAITFARTSGIASVPTGESRLFSDATVTTKDGATTLTFTQESQGGLWGYLVEYSGGNTTILCRKRPTLSSGDTPLAGVTIAVDAGHGGRDQGAAGLGAGGGLVEKDINLATAKTLKSQLEAKGATVIMTRETDLEISLDDRLALAQRNRADFMISLHCNSAPNVTGNGVEVYYYDSISRNLANNLSAGISAATNRTNRGGKYSCYVVTLNSYAPSVLVEMGFLTNADDYASLKTQNSADTTAKAIVNNIVGLL